MKSMEIPFEWVDEYIAYSEHALMRTVIPLNFEFVHLSTVDKKTFAEPTARKNTLPFYVMVHKQAPLSSYSALKRAIGGDLKLKPCL